MNKLAAETSPYLLQHADNPVDWEPWSEAALERARAENKPILLSVGYSACHWCHVMAHESFEDADIAALMNQHYINIKVDREERPDLDKIYQTAHSMLTERPGGWPLTVFLTPDDHMPIFAGTYFPKQPRHGMPSFSQVLEGIHNTWLMRKDDIAKQSASLRDAFQRIAQTGSQSASKLSAMPLDVARNQTTQQFDSQHGGYSGAPKFPHPAIIDRALRHWARTQHAGDRNSGGDAQVLHTAIFSLEKMAGGGLFDHLGGGFCRYSTDTEWMIPHFEKMLYDNGPLLWLCTQAWCITGDPLLLDAATETAGWVMREMQSAEGGYYSALDADSEGVEGKFYIWTPEQVASLLDASDYEIFARRFGLDRAANFEGHWHLHVVNDYNSLAQEFDTDAHNIRERMRTARDTLFEVREQRIHPGLDDKTLTSWNGLMIQGMAYAGRILSRPDYIDSAARAAAYLKTHHWQQGRLLATSKEGKSHLNAYLDDHAYLLSGLLELLQSRWDSDLLSWAQSIADVLIEQFEDADHGGFFFTSHDHEALIQRSKTYSDDAIPSGNGVAAQALIKLGYLTGETPYLEAAERCIKAAWLSINQAAISHCTLLNALEHILQSPEIIILRGNSDSLSDWHGASAKRYLPDCSIFAIPETATLPAALAEKKALDGACAYVCQGASCKPPILSLGDYEKHLDSKMATLPAK